jgi:hypothetical protein
MTILKKAMSLAGRTLIRIIKHPIGRWILIAVVLLLMLSIFLAIYQPSHRFSTTLEAGSPLPNPVDLTDRIDAVYLNAGDYDPTVPGVYRMTIRAGGGKYYLKVSVEDTVPPVGTVRPLNWGLGTVMPDASEFFTQIVDATAVTASYLNQNVYGAMGTYPVELLLRDAAGNEARYSTTLTLLKDTTPPTVTIQELSGCIGYGIAYRNRVIASDDCCGELKIEWDASEVDTNTPGKYPVYYTVTDASGNATRVENTIYIYEEEITPEMLYVRVDRIIDQIIKADMSTVDRVRAVYSYVYRNISYAGTSDKSDWMREAYQVLSSGSGDCFSYFALAKAFFERLGIENMDIQRTTGLTPDRHYWNYVNVGTKEEPRWYYFDATHLNSSDTGVSFNGSLLTEQQIMAYNKVRTHFYTFDHSGYPAAATEIITEAPLLEPYY